MTSRHLSLPGTRTTLRALSAALAALLLATGCDDEAPGGIGASASLPSIMTNFGAGDVDIGVGNVQWVGNPRW